MPSLGCAGLAQEAEEPALALFEPEVLGDHVLEVGEVARELSGVSTAIV